jgi:hypothetical protein
MTIQNLYNLRSTLLDLRNKGKTGSPLNVLELPTIISRMEERGASPWDFGCLLEYCVMNNDEIPRGWNPLGGNPTLLSLAEVVLNHRDTGRVVQVCLQYEFDPASVVAEWIEKRGGPWPYRYLSKSTLPVTETSV